VTTEQRAVRWAIFFGVSGFMLFLGGVVLRPFLHVLAWAIVLAIICNPVHQRLVAKTGRVTLSASLTSAIAVLAVVVPLVLVGAVAVGQFLALLALLPDTTSGQQDLTDRLAAVLALLVRRLGLNADVVAAWERQRLGELTRDAGQYTVWLVAGAADAIASFVFVVFALFLLLREGPRIVTVILDLLPFERRRSEAVLLQIRDVVHASMHGVVVIALAQGALCAVMFWLVGLPSAALWGAATVVTSVIPLLGAAAVWAPAALYLAVAGDWGRAIVLAMWGAAVVSSIDNFLRPRLVGDRVGLSELAMFFALLGGVKAFGVVGIVLGPAIFATIAAIVNVLTASPNSTGAPRGEASVGP
jgi:predicted PurR-regulated permease PerM